MMPRVPTDPGIVNAFFGDLCEKRGTSHPVFGKTHKKTLGNNGHPSAQTISGFKSALVWWHLENGVAINEALNGKLDMLIKGYKRRVGDWKQIGEMSALEGVQPLSFAGYELLAIEFLHLQRIYGDDRQNRLGDISIGILYNRASKKRKVIDISE